MRKLLRTVIVILLASWAGGAHAQECLLILKGDTSIISALAFSPNGKLFASGSWDRYIKIWDAQTGQLMRNFEAHKSMVTALSFGLDNKTLTSGSWEPRIKIWDAVNGDEIAVMSHAVTEKVTALSYSPDHKLMAVAAFDSIRLFDAEKNFIRAFGGHTNTINEVCFSPDGKRIASASWDRTVRIWDVATGKCIKTLKGHLANVNSVSFGPDGNTIVSAADDGLVRICDGNTGEFKANMNMETGITCAALAPDGKYIAGGCTDGKIRIMELLTEKTVKTFTGHTKPLTKLEFSANGENLASASEDMTIRIWDVTDLKYEQCIQDKMTEYSSMLAPKDEFETTEQYIQRLADYDKKKADARRECVKEGELQSIQNKVVFDEKHKPVFTYITIRLDNLSLYDADKQLYMVTIDSNKYELSMPVKDAKTFKTSWQKAVVSGIKKTNPVSKKFELINLAVVHPLSNIKYPIGVQVLPENDKELKEFIDKNGKQK